MNAVANMFDRNGEGYIDWKEFLAALRPDWEEPGPSSVDEIIHDEVKRQVQKCTCRNRFKVHQVGEGKYRVRITVIVLSIKVKLKGINLILMPTLLGSFENLKLPHNSYILLGETKRRSDD